MPQIRLVVDALCASPGLERLRIIVEPETEGAVAATLPPGFQVDYVAAADNLADSVLAAAAGVDQAMLVTTADNVLLTPAAVAAIVAAVTGGADAALAMATRAAVMVAHSDGQRRFYRFADDEYSNCNLYAFAGSQVLAADEGFRGSGQFAKKPMRLLAAVGIVSLVLILSHRASLRGALVRLSRRLGVRLDPVILADGAHGIDVNNARTYAVARDLLERRLATA